MGVQLGDTLYRDTLALLYSERVFGRFELDEWPNSAVAQMHQSLEVHGVRIRLQPGIQPPEERTNV